ncbi:hypothetical protein WICANDRAFT_51144 [Wickerhamomyces anomalus NRRL Y-366-8]|uniref:Mitochondrial nicotinamide adenine dinucleotide transporter 1 n=1 Tax=Wickerhamomyces anomalus (strain ATCC 58044 / CBS 1984 / NCYC 433 / NRRL Y-366-8) TaxID=683960 RepID=A0A1E3P529_WICAA|nr:uncharacterized protein WICANDRAFT_51144 [Wickerhamomyces anomalus NRRL Y-366-8]ODQ60576.1 hypothetical protein WICANDRAFT_51144 [Wickerhamomyces anomalus NRRL Y-366-8]
MTPLNTSPDPIRKSTTRSNFTDTQIIALSGALAGFIAGVSVCPLDVAKTRLQAQGLSSNKKYHGITGTLNTILKDEGVKGLYRGIVPIIMGYFPTWMIYFTVYEKAKLYYPKIFQNQFGHNNHNEFFVHSLSAFTAGSVSTSITNPIWVVKTRLMLQTGDESLEKNYYKNTIDAFKKMYKNEGFLVFYSGLIPSLFGLFHVAIHFPVYEKLKKFLKCDNFKSQTNDELQTHSNNLIRLITASSLSKMCASTLTYPHEILRTRMQISSFNKNKSIKTGLINTILNIYKKEGLIGFYQGFTTNLARTVPASAVTLVSFEYISRYLTTALK